MPPTELTAARTAYGTTTNGPASQLAPQAVLEARGALDRAEASFKENGDTPETRTLAYVAERKAEIARSHGRMAQHERDIRTAARDLSAVEQETLADGKRLAALDERGARLHGERAPARAPRARRDRPRLRGDDRRAPPRRAHSPNPNGLQRHPLDGRQLRRGHVDGRRRSTPRLDRRRHRAQRARRGRRASRPTSTPKTAATTTTASSRENTPSTIAAYLATHGVPRADDPGRWPPAAPHRSQRGRLFASAAWIERSKSSSPRNSSSRRVSSPKARVGVPARAFLFPLAEELLDAARRSRPCRGSRS